ncbi:MAG: hypothetical protein WBW80_14540 [Acidimicrobiales bacterium]
MSTACSSLFRDDRAERSPADLAAADQLKNQIMAWWADQGVMEGDFGWHGGVPVPASDLLAIFCGGFISF